MFLCSSAMAINNHAGVKALSASSHSEEKSPPELEIDIEHKEEINLCCL